MINFKPIEKADLELLHKWMNVDFVSKWYERRKFIYDDVERKLSNSDTSVPVKSYIIQLDFKSIGYIQSYRISDYPKFQKCLDVDDGYIGIDMFIGDKEYIHQGHGKDIVKRFVKAFVFKTSIVTHCLVSVEPTNTSAIKTYEKAGFKFIKEVTCQSGLEKEYVMTIRKSYEQVVYSKDV